MLRLDVPKYIKNHLFTYDSVDDIPDRIFDKIASEFEAKVSKNPLVSIVIIAYNEEKTILRTLSSLAALESNYPFEVIVVNNNSTDRTQEILDKCGVKSVFEARQGVGFARQAGLDAAKGIYHLSGDADTIYPPQYVNVMINHLKKPGTVAVFGHVSFIPDGEKSRFQLGIYEFFKDFVVMLRAINRPELSLGGANFGFVSGLGKKIGWRTDIKRGEDGSMALALKEYGKIKRVNKGQSKVWTSARTLDADGSYFEMIWKRISREAKRISEYFTPQKGSYETKEQNII